MDINNEKTIQNLFRVGKVSSVNPDNDTVRVVFPDKNNMVTAELPVLNRGSKVVKDYWLPDIGEQVLCLFLPNGNSQGFCVGSYFSDVDAPVVMDANIRRQDFGDGTYIEYNRSTHELTINCVGNVTIKGATINLN